MHIQKATKKYFVDIHKMLNAVQDVHHTLDTTYATAITNDAFKKFLRTNDLIFIALDDENTVCGMIAGTSHLQNNDNTTHIAMVRSIWVEPKNRARGTATSLMQTFEQEAKKTGAIYSELYVDIRNHLAMHFWSEASYTPYQKRLRRKL